MLEENPELMSPQMRILKDQSRKADQLHSGLTGAGAQANSIYVYPDLNIFRLLDLDTKFWGSAVFSTFEELAKENVGPPGQGRYKPGGAGAEYALQDLSPQNFYQGTGGKPTNSSNAFIPVSWIPSLKRSRDRAKTEFVTLCCPASVAVIRLWGSHFEDDLLFEIPTAIVVKEEKSKCERPFSSESQAR